MITAPLTSSTAGIVPLSAEFPSVQAIFPPHDKEFNEAMKVCDRLCPALNRSWHGPFLTDEMDVQQLLETRRSCWRSWSYTLSIRRERRLLLCVHSMVSIESITLTPDKYWTNVTGIFARYLFLPQSECFSGLQAYRTLLSTVYYLFYGRSSSPRVGGFKNRISRFVGIPRIVKVFSNLARSSWIE